MNLARVNPVLLTLPQFSILITYKNILGSSSSRVRLMLLRNCRLTICSSIVGLNTYGALSPYSHTANWTIEYNPLVYNFEDWSILNDFEFGFMPSSSPSLSSLLESELESPISGSSFTSAEDLFDDTGIDPNDLSRYLYNKPTAAYRASLLVSTDL